MSAQDRARFRAAVDVLRKAHLSRTEIGNALDVSPSMVGMMASESPSERRKPRWGWEGHLAALARDRAALLRRIADDADQLAERLEAGNR